MRPPISTLLRQSSSSFSLRYTINTNDVIRRQRQRLFQELFRLHEMHTSAISNDPSFHHHHHSSIQKRQFWWMFSSSNSDTKDSDADGDGEKESSKAAISMPPRRNDQRSSPSSPSSSSSPPTNNNETKIERHDSQVQQIVDIPIGGIDDDTWAKASTLLEKNVAQNNTTVAFVLLDRLSKEPNANLKLTQDLIYPVVKQWSISYAWQQRQNTHMAGTNKLYPPIFVWRKVDTYISRGIDLTSSTFHRVIDATAYVKATNLINKNGPLLAETIVRRMMELSVSRNSRIRPTRYTFKATIASWEAAAMNVGTRSEEYTKAANHALGLLDRLKELYESSGGERELMPNSETYMKVMRFYAHVGDGDKVEELMEDMYGMYLARDKDESLLPTTDLFSLVLFAWSRSSDPGAAQRATQILDQILYFEAQEVIPGLEITARVYNIALVCWSRVGTEEGLIQMQALCDRMMELSKTDPKKKATGSTYAAMVTGWSQIDPARAEQIVWTWKKAAQQGDCTIRLDAKLIGTLIGGWYNSKSPDTAEMCDRILQNALEEGADVNVSTFNMAINAWCRKKSIESVDRAESLLRQMQELRDKKNKLDLKPTIFTYAPIIFGYANPGRCSRGEALLREFFERYPSKDRGHTNSSRKSRLETRLFNCVLRSWVGKAAIDSEAVDRSEKLLLDMPSLEVHPDIASFNMVLQSKERQKKSSIGKQATLSRSDEIIELLDAEYKEGNLGCTLEHYLTKRQAWVLFNS